MGCKFETECQPICIKSNQTARPRIGTFDELELLINGSRNLRRKHKTIIQFTQYQSSFHSTESEFLSKIREWAANFETECQPICKKVTKLQELDLGLLINESINLRRKHKTLIQFTQYQSSFHSAESKFPSRIYSAIGSATLQNPRS